MGNCLFRQKAATFADDDKEDEHWIEKEEADELGTMRKQSPSTSSSSTEVRIRISKKQLEELLRRAEFKGSLARVAVEDLINLSAAGDNSHWRPALKSIAEEPDD